MLRFYLLQAVHATVDSMNVGHTQEKYRKIRDTCEDVLEKIALVNVPLWMYFTTLKDVFFFW